MADHGPLVESEPSRWGLRGDLHLWRALRDHLCAEEISASRAGVVGLLYAAFSEITGVNLASHPELSVYREQFAHGGMSSGMISLETWRDQLIPLLAERAELHGAQSG